LVRPVTVKGEEAPVAVNEPGLDVTVKPVIAEPPVLAGAVIVMVAVGVWIAPSEEPVMIRGVFPVCSV
jgi:hypothetical protein